MSTLVLTSGSSSDVNPPSYAVIATTGDCADEERVAKIGYIEV